MLRCMHGPTSGRVNIGHDMKTILSLTAGAATFCTGAMVAIMGAATGNMFGAAMMLAVGAIGAVCVFIACND